MCRKNPVKLLDVFFSFIALQESRNHIKSRSAKKQQQQQQNSYKSASLFDLIAGQNLLLQSEVGGSQHFFFIVGDRKSKRAGFQLGGS